MSLKEIEARRDAELADIDFRIEAAHGKGDENEAERLERFRAKRAADYLIEMTHDPEYTGAIDDLRGMNASLLSLDRSSEMARIAGTMKAFSAGAAHLADAVERHVAGRGRKRPAKRTAAKAAEPAPAKPARPAAAGSGSKPPAESTGARKGRSKSGS